MPGLTASRPDIAIFTPTLEGGVGRVIANLAFGFTKLGRFVEIVTLRPPTAMSADVPRNVSIVSLNVARASKAVVPLARYFKAKRPSHLLSASFHANLAAIIARRLSRSKTKLHVSEHIALGMALPQLSWPKCLAIKTLVRLLYPSADTIISVSEGAALDIEKIVRVKKEKVHAIMNPVITPDLSTLASEEVSHEWFKPGQPPVIIAIGRLTSQKDFPTLLRAFALVKQKQPARLIILGEGEDRTKLESLASQLSLTNDVRLPGYSPNPYKYLKRAAVFVLSSTFEGLPTVLIEALALGIPVVSTDCQSGPDEILENGKWGDLVPVGDARALAGSILAVLSGNKKPAPPEETLEKYTAAFAAKRYLEVIKFHSPT